MIAINVIRALQLHLQFAIEKRFMVYWKLLWSSLFNKFAQPEIRKNIFQTELNFWKINKKCIFFCHNNFWHLAKKNWSKRKVIHYSSLFSESCCSTDSGLKRFVFLWNANKFTNLWLWSQCFNVCNVQHRPEMKSHGRGERLCDNIGLNLST